MSLGILNNLNAIYSENNLNRSSNSLATVLQQLSSGSKINSGADDAAGLALVDGLQDNQQALTQSEINETEGVGLLQVADGALYIGAQINTLNAVNEVLDTEQENVTAAQNAVQATDYASATSNMSKYEILSQTGISALAQANSLQQEVTKLLQ